MTNIAYKYLSCRPEFFDNYLLRASGRLHLNDPFEVNPSIRYFAEMCFQSGSSYGNTAEETEEFLKKKSWNGNWRIQKNPEFDKNGVICLTKKPDNILMWAHYADEHKGYVLEIDVTDKNLAEAFKNGETSGLFIRDVEYDSSRLEKYSGIVEPFFHKSIDWIYEEEKRILVNLFDCHSKLIQKSSLDELIFNGSIKDVKSSVFNKHLMKIEDCSFPGNLCHLSAVMFMFKIPPSAITSVICGAKMAQGSIESIEEKILSKSESKHIKIKKADLHNYNYEVVIPLE